MGVTQGLSPDIITDIVERTDGVPLLVEELTKAVLESAGQSTSWFWRRSRRPPSR